MSQIPVAAWNRTRPAGVLTSYQRPILFRPKFFKFISVFHLQWLQSIMFSESTSSRSLFRTAIGLPQIFVCLPRLFQSISPSLVGYVTSFIHAKYYIYIYTVYTIYKYVCRYICIYITPIPWLKSMTFVADPPGCAQKPPHNSPPVQAA